tara:strand:+ start:2684 stop:3067 length:384 start_codon:yes stop_codon:yes gene_type:complete
MNQWYKSLKKAPWTPPSYVFGIVWPILYAMMAVSFFLVWKNKKCFPYCSPLTMFFIQLGFNLIWTTLFFKFRLIKVAFIDLIIIIIFTLLTMKEFAKISHLATYLLVPYILWLLVAFSMNLYIVMMN